MADTNALQAILLGFIEGLTEFIPVSSTGHLILLVDMLGFKGPPGHLFEIVIQLGAILAICWLYRKRLLDAVISAPKDKTKRQFLMNILIAVLPAMVLGVLLHGFIKSVLFNPTVVAIMLVIGGIAILFIEKHKPEPILHDIEQMNWKLALKIGLCQTVAMIPGTSRSGATIMGALLLKVDRKVATEFSFFLAIPTMLAATAYDLYKNADSLTADGAGIIALGFASAFLAALAVVKTVVGFVSRHGFVPFAWYRIVLGTVMLVLLLA
jgi:undecaprenyl-diphosphatase